MAVTKAEFSCFRVFFWGYTDYSPPRWVDFDSDVSDDEGFNKLLNDLMATGSLESNDSGVSLKSDRSKAGQIDFKDRVSPRPDFFSSEEEDLSDDEDLVESRDNQMAVREAQLRAKIWMDFYSDLSAVKDLNKPLDDQSATGSIKSFDSGVSLKSDRSNGRMIDFKDRVSPRPDDLIGPDINPVGDHDNLRADVPIRRHSFNRRATGSLESIDSGVSLKSDRSKAEPPTDFKDRVSPSGSDFSSSVKKHVVADDGFFESQDDLEEMNQELSSEVGWKHG